MLSGVTHAYESGTDVLSDITVRLAPGERVALVGGTGADKSTLGSIAAGQLRPTRGTVTLGGHDVHGLDEKTIRTHVALITQGARELEGAALVATAARSSLVVAHRLTQARSADRILVMHRGRIVEEGSHDVLVAAGGRYADLWQAWSR